MNILKYFLALFLMLSSGCSDSENTAGGVTDIGNSIAGIALNENGIPETNATVQIYKENWRLAKRSEYEETLTDSSGRFLFENIPFTPNGIYAKTDSLSILLNENKNLDTIILKKSVPLQGKVQGKSEGFVRVLGSNLKVPLMADGSFAFSSLPVGNITFVYIENDSSLAYAKFNLEPNSDSVFLPPFSLEEKDSLLKIDDLSYYEKECINGICFLAEDTLVYPTKKIILDSVLTETFQELVIPLYINKDSLKTSDFTLLDKNNNPLAFEIEEETESEILLWVKLDSLEIGSKEILLKIMPYSTEQKEQVFSEENFMAVLHLNENETVKKDSVIIDSLQYVEGIFGDAIQLRYGEFIDLGYLDPCANDFTLSLWTFWNGSNDNHQILFSERAYWSDSTSRFQWHYENPTNSFMILKSSPGVPTGFTLATGDNMKTEEWVHLALVSKNNLVSMFINGQKMGEPQEFIPNELAEQVPFTVGGNEISDETWNGRLDEIRVESVARSDAYIKTLYELSKKAKNK